jgi:hypothetical protein
LEVKWSKDSSKIGGLGFRFKGDYRIASKVDQSFSLVGLQKQGLDFAPARDIPALARPVLGPPSAHAAAKIATITTLSVPQVAAITVPPIFAPRLPKLPEVLHVRPQISPFQSIVRFASELAARIWGAVVPAHPASANRQPERPGRYC